MEHGFNLKIMQQYWSNRVENHKDLNYEALWHEK
jgi:hypothetical protein